MYPTSILHNTYARISFSIYLMHYHCWSGYQRVYVYIRLHTRAIFCCPKKRSSQFSIIFIFIQIICENLEKPIDNSEVWIDNSLKI